jgi:outer membrane protein
MKKQFLIIFLTLLISGTASAQKFGYIDSEYILKKMPEYQEAQKELEKVSSNWQKEIEEKKKEVDKLKEEYSAEEVLLTEDMKEERLHLIAEKEKALKEYQKKTFGFDGLIFLKRQELIKPVQDKLFEAVEKVAKAKRLQIIFDKAGDLVMLYTNPIHDYTDYVLEELGLGDPNDTVK